MTNHDEPVGLRDEVARAVMGWTSESRSWAYSGAATLWFDEAGTGLLPVQAWRPDEDDSQCMQVLDRMCDLGYAFLIRSEGAEVAAAFHRPGKAATTVTHAQRRIAMLHAAVAARRADDTLL